MSGREIKFRAWDASRMQMIYEFGQIKNDKPELIQTEDGFIICGHHQDNRDWCEPILMQFTGLKDKNGKEIYEGDIVRHFTIEEPDVVMYKKGAFGYKGYSNREGDFISYAQNSFNLEMKDDKLATVEVIGNIHQNPELLPS